MLCCTFQRDAGLGTYPLWTRPADTCGRRDWPSPHGHRGACWGRGVGVHPTVLRASGRQAGLLASTLRKALVPGRGARERLRKERVSQERGATVWGEGSGENVSPTWFLHPTQLLEMKTAVEPAFPVFHFPSKQSCIPSEPLNIYLINCCRTRSSGVNHLLLLSETQDTCFPLLVYFQVITVLQSTSPTAYAILLP